MIPEKYKVLSGSALKLIALVTMIIDHTASVLLRESTAAIAVLGFRITLYDLMRDIGRLAFPIYAFLLVEGFLHTRNRRRYAVRLFVFALISEIPWNLEHSGKVFMHASQNVYFTLLLGFLGLCALEREDLLERGLLLFGLYAVGLLAQADYGVRGYGFVLLLYLLREQKLVQALLGSCFLSIPWASGLAFIPINLYNGKRGFIRGKWMQYAFYAAYPLHLLALYYIKLKTMGY